MQNKALLLIVVLLILGGAYFFLTNSANPEEELMTDERTAISNEETQDPERMMVEDGTAMTEEDAMVEEDKVMENDGTGMMEDENVKVFEVGGGAFYFTPEEMTITEGDTVKIVFTNEGGTHDWVLDEFDARTPVTQTGETAEVTFVADQAGTFEYYCSVGNHRTQGMVGTLIVQPAL